MWLFVPEVANARREFSSFQRHTDNVKIRWTRIIHIYEANFNLMLGLKWRMALYQEEALKLLNDVKYGSRPSRNATDPVMIEEMQFKVYRLSCRKFIQTNYDVTACYDRIIPNLAMIVSQKFGIQPSLKSTSTRYYSKRCISISAPNWASRLQPVIDILRTCQFTAPAREATTLR